MAGLECSLGAGCTAYLPDPPIQYRPFSNIHLISWATRRSKSMVVPVPEKPDVTTHTIFPYYCSKFSIISKYLINI